MTDPVAHDEQRHRHEAAPDDSDPHRKPLSPAEEAIIIHRALSRINDDYVRVQALGTLYEAERHAVGGIHSSILTTVVSLLTYVGILGGFLSAMEKVNSLVVPYLPLPAWALGVFFVVQLGQLQAHGKSIKIVERDVVEAAGLSPQARFVGSGSERRWAKLSSPTPSTFVFFATFFVSLGIITAVSFAKVIGSYGYWPATLYIAVALYLLLILGIAASIRKLFVAITHPERDDPDD